MSRLRLSDLDAIARQLDEKELDWRLDVGKKRYAEMEMTQRSLDFSLPGVNDSFRLLELVVDRLVIQHERHERSLSKR